MYNKFWYLYICGGGASNPCPSSTHVFGYVWALCMPLFSVFVASRLVMVTGDTTIKAVHMHSSSDVEVAL